MLGSERSFELIKKMKNITIYCLLLLSAWTIQAQTTIQFASEDELSITADLYKTHEQAPFIILFHQAGWSRGEYAEIAPKLNSMGFNCLAVDQRSGGEVNGVKNETKQAAEKLGKGTTYVDALPDMRAAIAYVKKTYNPEKLIIWGSSYSSALSLKLAGDHPDQIDGVLAFAPGEYFKRQGKPGDYITTSAKKISQPAFITSAKAEKNNWWGIYEAIPEEKKQHYLPKTAGNHGARALWSKFSDHQGYWEAVTSFLTQFK